VAFIDFLNWLWSRILSVLDWFGDEYSNLVHNVRNIWTYAQNWGLWAYNTALNDVREWVNAIYVNIASGISGTIDFINSLINDVRGDITVTRIKIVVAEAAAERYANDKIGEVIQNVTTGFNGYVDAKIRDLVNNINIFLDSSLNPFKPILSLVNVVDKLIFITGGNVFNRIIVIINTDFSVMVMIVNNPIGFIFNIIEPKLLGYLSWLLAYALGTTVEELPPKPDWNNYGKQ
jgi:hypothetical protein